MLKRFREQKNEIVNSLETLLENMLIELKNYQNEVEKLKEVNKEWEEHNKVLLNKIDNLIKGGKNE